MKTLISILVCAMLALTVSSAEAQVTCSPGVPANICQDAAPFFSGHHYTEASIRIEIVTPNELQTRDAVYEKETSVIKEDCDCFNQLKPRVMVNTFSQEIMLLRDKPDGVHVSEVLISFEAFYGFDFSKGTTTDSVFHLPHNSIFDPAQANLIAAYIEGFTDAVRFLP